MTTTALAHVTNNNRLEAPSLAAALAGWSEYWLINFPAALPDIESAKKHLEAIRAATGRWQLPPSINNASTPRQQQTSDGISMPVERQQTYAPVARLNPAARGAQAELPGSEQATGSGWQVEDDEAAMLKRQLYKANYEYVDTCRALFKPRVFAVLWALIEHSNPKRDGGRFWAWPSLANIAGECHISSRTAAYAIESLIANNLIDQKRSGKLRGSSNGYELALPTPEKIAFLKEELAKVGCANCKRLVKKGEEGMQKLALQSGFEADQPFAWEDRVCKICKPPMQKMRTGKQTLPTTMQNLQTNYIERTKTNITSFEYSSSLPTLETPDKTLSEPEQPQKPAGTAQVEAKQGFTKLPAQLSTLMSDLSREFNDSHSAPSNLSRIANLYAKSGLGSENFAYLMQEARKKTARAAVSKTAANGHKVRTPYFFTVLNELIAEAGQPQPLTAAPVVLASPSARAGEVSPEVAEVPATASAPARIGKINAREITAGWAAAIPAIASDGLLPATIFEGSIIEVDEEARAVRLLLQARAVDGYFDQSPWRKVTLVKRVREQFYGVNEVVICEI